jgi:hypothetical protein
MYDDDDELRKTKQQLQSKQVSLFIVLWCVGVFVSAVFFEVKIDLWGFLASSCAACYVACVLSKQG